MSIDAVVIAADDLADGRSITTMLHATAAGAYLKDEIRTTNGSLVSPRVSAPCGYKAGFSKTVLRGRRLVAANGRCRESIASGRASTRAGGRALVDPASSLFPCPTVGACAACVLSELPNGRCTCVSHFAHSRLARPTTTAGSPVRR